MLKTLIHRATVITAGVLLGLTTLMAAPAHADGPTKQVDITGSAQCDRAAGEWTVSWTITNNWTTQAKVDKLKTAPAAVPGLADGFQIPRRSPSGTVGRQPFTQVLTGSPAEASVSFVADWGKEGKDADNSATVPLGDCSPPCVEKADARFHHEFTLKDGRATAKVTLDDGVKLCAGEPVTLVTYFAPKPQFSVPQYAFAHQSGVISNENRSVDLSADLPDCYTQADLFFGGEDDIIEEINDNPVVRYGDRKLGSSKGSGARSTGPQGWYNGGSKACQQPQVQPVSQCDGTVDIALSNPGAQSKYPVDFTIKAGDFSRTVTVAPGRGDTVRVPANSGPITVTADGLPTVTYTWARPENCAPPTVKVVNDCKTVAVTVTNPQDATPAPATVTYGDASKQVTVAPGGSERVEFPAGDATTVTVTFTGLDIAPVVTPIEQPVCEQPPGDGGGNGEGGGDGGSGGGNGDGGGLPVTGAAAGGIAAGAVVLLIAGGVLFLVARRRRVTFKP